jgi:two-component system NarL family response regulator
MRVLLVDDSPLFVQGMKEALEINGIEVAGVAYDAASAIAMAEELKPGVVLMDVQMPGIDGIEATRIIKSLLPRVHIVMLTVSENDDYLFAAIEAGASGYLLKNSLNAESIQSLLNLENGQTPLTPGLAQKLFDEFSRRSRGPQPDSDERASMLSARQKEILSLAAQGYTYAEIASLQAVAEVTVRYHMNQIVRVLQLENRAQAIAWGSRNLRF